MTDAWVQRLRDAVEEFRRELSPADRAAGWDDEKRADVLETLSRTLTEASRGHDELVTQQLDRLRRHASAETLGVRTGRLTNTLAAVTGK